MIRRLWIGFGAMLALAGCMPAVLGGGGALPIAFLGSWEGRGSQSDAPGEWTIAVEIMGGGMDGAAGRIEYPSLECGGTLTLRVAAPGALELDERITHGDCVDGGIVTLTEQQDGRLRYDWRQEGSALTAEGMLQRARR